MPSCGRATSCLFRQSDRTAESWIRLKKETCLRKFPSPDGCGDLADPLVPYSGQCKDHRLRLQWLFDAAYTLCGGSRKHSRQPARCAAHWDRSPSWTASYSPEPSAALRQARRTNTIQCHCTSASHRPSRSGTGTCGQCGAPCGPGRAAPRSYPVPQRICRTRPSVVVPRLSSVPWMNPKHGGMECALHAIPRSL